MNKLTNKFTVSYPEADFTFLNTTPWSIYITNIYERDLIEKVSNIFRILFPDPYSIYDIIRFDF